MINRIERSLFQARPAKKLKASPPSLKGLIYNHDPMFEVVKCLYLEVSGQDTEQLRASVDTMAGKNIRTASVFSGTGIASGAQEARARVCLD